MNYLSSLKRLSQQRKEVKDGRFDVYNAGVTAVCVLTGEATVDEILSGNIRPTYVFKSIKDLVPFVEDFHNNRKER